MKLWAEDFGEYQDKKIQLCWMENNAGTRVGIIPYGASLVSVQTKNKVGELRETHLRLKSFDEYVKQDAYVGAVIGPIAGRITNADLHFKDKIYKLTANDGINHLHSADGGISDKVFDIFPLNDGDSASYILTYSSPKGLGGYPFSIDYTVRYTLTDENELRIEMSAYSDEDFLCSMTHHAYWNLSNNQNNTISSHKLMIPANNRFPHDSNLLMSIPLEAVDSVYNFSKARAIGETEYDCCFLLDNKEESLIELESEESGKKMLIKTNQEALQFYTGNFLDGSFIQHGDKPAHKRTFLCIEPQGLPNCIDIPGYKGSFVKGGTEYKNLINIKLTTI